MVNFTGSDIVLWIHVLAACIWIGGQITLGMMMPMLRTVPDIMRDVARRFQNLAWVAYAMLIVTGLVNLHDAGISLTNLNADAQSRTLPSSSSSSSSRELPRPSMPIGSRP
jgi:uncharacterized membrane protein